VIFIAGEEVIIVMVLMGLSTFVSVAIYASRFRRVPPNMAMVVYGRKRPGSPRGFEVVSGGGRFIAPISEEVAWLRTQIRDVVVPVKDLVTDVLRSGARLNVHAVAQVKITTDPAGLLIAAENLLGKKDAEINDLARKMLEGHTRGVCATLTVSHIASDQDVVASRIRELATRDLTKVGIEIQAYVFRDLEDVDGYLARFREETARVKAEDVAAAVRSETARILGSSGTGGPGTRIDPPSATGSAGASSSRRRP